MCLSSQQVRKQMWKRNLEPKNIMRVHFKNIESKLNSQEELFQSLSPHKKILQQLSTFHTKYSIPCLPMQQFQINMAPLLRPIRLGKNLHSATGFKGFLIQSILTICRYVIQQVASLQSKQVKPLLEYVKCLRAKKNILILTTSVTLPTKNDGFTCGWFA